MKVYGILNISHIHVEVAGKSRKVNFIKPKLANATTLPHFAMSSSEDSEASYTDYEYEIEAKNDVDRAVSPPTSDDDATAFADGPLADPEWIAQYDKEIEKKKGSGTRAN